MNGRGGKWRGAGDFHPARGHQRRCTDAVCLSPASLSPQRKEKPLSPGSSRSKGLDSVVIAGCLGNYTKFQGRASAQAGDEGMM